MVKVLQIAIGEEEKGGGVGRIASSIASIISKNNMESILACCYLKKKSNRDYKVRKIEAIRIPFFSSLVIPLNLLKIIKEEKPDIIISHSYSSTLPLFSYFISKLFGIKHIIAAHSYPKGDFKTKALMFFYDLLALIPLKDSEIIYFSNSAKKELKKEGEVFMFVPEKRFFSEAKAKKEKKEYILFVGRIDENKRPLMFLEISKRVGESPLLIGIPEDRELVEKINKFRANIKIAKIEEMPSIYKKAKLLITTSMYEGLPITWLEAIASEVPILTTKVGDYEEVLKEFYGKQWREFVFENVEEGEKKAKKILGMFKTKKFKDLLRNAKEKLKNRRKVFEKSLLGFIKKLGVRDRNDKV